MTTWGKYILSESTKKIDGKNAFFRDNSTSISHFRVALSVIMKAGLNAKLFI